VAESRKQRVARLSKNPATRASLKDADLTPALLAERRKNKRLAQPIVPGSDISRRELAHQREAAVTTKFGPDAQAKEAQRQRDVGGWYDTYVQELARHRQNVLGQNAQAQQQLAGISQAARGLDTQTLANQLAPSVQDATARGMQVSPDLAQVAGGAASTRQGLLANFMAQSQQLGANAGNYASNLAHVVGPGQRLQGLAQTQRRRDDLDREIGAFRTGFESDARDQARKAVLENQAFGLDTAKFEADQANQSFDNQLAAQRFELDASDTAADNARADAAAREKGKSKVKWQPDAAQAKARAGVGRTIELAKTLRAGKGVRNPKFVDDEVTPDQPEWIIKPGKHSRQKAARALLNDPKALDPALVSAALDIAYMGYLHPNTVKKLHAGGYKVNPMGYPIKGRG